MVLDFMLPQVFPCGKYLAALFAAIAHMLCITLLGIFLLYGIVPHEPLRYSDQAELELSEALY
jgi:hypothetical protein